MSRTTEFATTPFSGSLLERVSELVDGCHCDEYALTDHALRVAHVAERLALDEGRSAPEARRAWLAGFLHDAGKVLVANAIHFKPGPLTFEEREVMRRHPELGASLLETLGMEDAVAAVRHHHERIDGSGYPDGLAGEAVPKLARLIAVADHYAALRERRTYRAGHTHAEAIAACVDEARALHLDLRYTSRLAELPEATLWPPDVARRAPRDVVSVAS